MLYLWGLGASGWANTFYSAAAQAGSQSWKAFFFGSSDAANSITVDKTPASLWVMAASVRLFGLNAWSILVPQALMGVATVGLLHATVRRCHGHAAGLIAGAVMALTPVAVLMFRFNNPDALLVLALVAGAYAVVRAVETASTGWLALAGALVGFGFLSKMLQALLVVPAFALAYLVAAPAPLRRRIVSLLAAGGALLLSAGWWIAVVELVPASMRPYIGGSQNNSILELVLGYNGLGRLTGDETGSVGGGSGGWGETGGPGCSTPRSAARCRGCCRPRVLLASPGSWSYAGLRAPTGLARRCCCGAAGWRSPGSCSASCRGSSTRTTRSLWPRRSVRWSAPARCCCGIGARSRPRARCWRLTVAVTAAWAYVLLQRSTDFVPWLAPLVLVVGLLAALALTAVTLLPTRVLAVVAGLALVASFAGPTAYALQTASEPHTGVDPHGRSGGRRGARRARRRPGGFRGGGPQGMGGLGPQGMGGMAGPQGLGGMAGPLGMPAVAGGAGGLLEGSTAGAELVALLAADASSYTWVAAAVGSNTAAGYQLATGHPVMAIGGFNGSDPSPTLAQFQAYVAAGKIHYFIGSGGFGGMQQSGGSSSSAEIAAWVAATFPARPSTASPSTTSPRPPSPVRRRPRKARWRTPRYGCIRSVASAGVLS